MYYLNLRFFRTNSRCKAFTSSYHCDLTYYTDLFQNIHKNEMHDPGLIPFAINYRILLG